ncbi:MAG: arginine decarboxylase, pyruvoyl-dependent [Candidatus Margulisbacteria bacterium]|nr:arginine decarboxylase, pyruvoyl-dependent [Candidatus Margulisiibacteriota bacterium]
MVPKEVFLTKGVGRHKEKLHSFEIALRDAGIEQFNIVRVSSIFPPYCKIIPREKGLQKLSTGQILFVVLSTNSTNEPNRLIASSIGLAIPADKTRYGYLSEHHSFGETESVSGDYAEDLAASMLASTLGIEYDENLEWDERKEQWKMRGEIVKTTHITQSALGDKNGLWTSVLSAAVFICSSEEEQVDHKNKYNMLPLDKESTNNSKE